MEEKIRQLKEWIEESDNVVFFGGAGVSTESGIPDFRSQDGLYHQEYAYPPETILSHSFFLKNPKEFYRFYQNKMLVLVNPHNPTGRIFDREDLEKIAQLANKYNVVVFSDEIFAETTQGKRVIPYAELDPVMGISCTSLGKTFNLTGVNQANLVIPNDELREKYSHQKDIDHFGSIDPFFYTTHSVPLIHSRAVNGCSR